MYVNKKGETIALHCIHIDSFNAVEKNIIFFKEHILFSVQLINYHVIGTAVNFFLYLIVLCMYLFYFYDPDISRKDGITYITYASLFYSRKNYSKN
jgi:hypothetical protein